ncbi:MAG: ribonuclease III [Coxiellaceae bacterium]|nr:ribonuclease III [Coxiellaceae bacterium]
MTQYDELYKKMDYTFNDAALCEHALVHRSFSRSSNERLEFLGDSILGFIVAHELYQRYPDMPEGDLSRLRSSLVNGEILADIALTLHFNDFMQLGQGEERSGGRTRRSILADAVEAMIAAVYLDSNFETCLKTVLHWWKMYLDDISGVDVAKDSKSTLQEWTQANKLPLPIYQIISVDGKAHEQTFTIGCFVVGLDYKSVGISSSRRKAEQFAARHYLELIDDKQ